MRFVRLVMIVLGLSLPVLPALAQITVLDSAQDAEAVGVPTAPSEPLPACGRRPLSIARMSWPSAALLAEIHARILADQFDCDIRVVQGDQAATISSMGSIGQPQIAPELWINRIADLWNGAMEGQMVRSAAPSYASSQFEGWYMPSALAASLSTPPTAAGLAQALAQLPAAGRVQFISCPIDWACSIINRNLIAAHGLDDLVTLVEPANRLEMDRLIAEAVNRREPFLFYYWQPNAILAQLDFVAVDMGDYNEAAAQCLAGRTCADPKPSAFPSDAVVTALAERVFTETPLIAGYFQRASMPLVEMDELLAQLNQPGASVESVADRFVAERAELWQGWVGAAP
ncbi:glycine betaine ABC transporter substrate-binding protein [Devosia sp. XK-2]|uniref:glycine betaine ABC transporter substrate-binding protein n=1 Tax=Devosia sp. XK-2 TaxID=3126689 RepID=UPI0030D46FF6